jgi:hypothetical protein
MADAAVAAMIEQLTAQIEGACILKPCEDKAQVKGGVKSDFEGPLDVWRKGGSSLAEWLERRECVSQLSSCLVSHNPAYTVAYSERADVCVQVP